MMYFCTYFDINYLPRAMAMYASLVRHCGDFHLFMLCFDSASVERLKSLSLSHTTVIPLEEFERGDSALVATKETRTKLEYYYTCGPSLPLYVFKTFPEVDLITYLDADLFFYASPAPLLREVDGYSIGITVHYFPEFRPSPHEGKYNVGWLTFRRDNNGVACLQSWREKCIEWCYERFENGKYADQMYLDDWPSAFQGVKILENKGANVAAWNVQDYRITFELDQVMISGSPLIFYHFHGFKQLSKHLYNTNLGLTFRFPSRILKTRVFLPYIKELTKHAVAENATRSIRKKRLRPQWIQMIRTFGRTLIGITFRQYVIVRGDRVY